MYKKYVKLGLLLLVTGSAVLGWVLKEKSKDQQRAAFYKSKYGSDPEEYLQQYNEWLQLPPEQRANLPWWLDKYGKTKTEEQLQKEQQERLNADLDKLATGKKDANPFADILYGENWRIKLNEYKKQRRMRGHIFTGSIVCALSGGAIVSCCLLLWIYQILMKASSNLRKSVPVVSRGQSPNKDKKTNQVVTKEKIIPMPKARAKVEAERKSKPTAEKLVQAKAEASAKAQTQEKVRAKVEAKAKVKEERIDKAESESREKEETGEKVGVSAEDGKTMDQHQERRGLRRRDKKQTKALGNSDGNTCKQDSANRTAVLIPDEKSIELV